MFFKGFFLTLLGLGVFFLVQATAPAIAFGVWQLSFLGSSILVDPNPDKKDVLGVSIQKIGDFPAFISTADPSNLPYREFSLSIPSIKLPKTPVKVASNEFEHALSQLPGTALPGEVGNVFISGHSSLPQFYRPDNFEAIFSNLPNIKKGDEINVGVLGQQLTYEVTSLEIVSPSDTWVINPPDSTGRYLSLMTCVPPGFNTKRLIVLSRLKE